MDQSPPVQDQFQPRGERFSEGTGSSFKGVSRSVFGYLLLMVFLIAGSFIGVVIWRTQETISELARSVINTTTTHAHSELRGFFDPVYENLMVTRAWGLSGQLDLVQVEQLNTLLRPVLRHNPEISSLLIGNARGAEFLLLRDGDNWRNRITRAEEWGPRRHWMRWSDQGELLEEYWDEEPYDTRERRWYKGALSRPEGLIHWTEPYSFHTTGQAGITASTRWTPAADNAVEHVIALDVLLDDLSIFTSGFPVEDNGRLVVMTGDTRVFGLPGDPRFKTPEGRADALLKPAGELGLPELTRAVELWKSLPLPTEVPRRFGAGDGRIWSGFRPFDLGSKRRLWIAVVVPESDFVGEVRRQNILIFSVMLGVLVVAIVIGFLMVRGLRQRVREQVRQLGQYTLEEKLGEGGMGTVYRARHAMLRRPTAVKLLKAEKEGEEEAIKRFEQEVQITSQLTHPNTVAIFDYGRTRDGIFYYAMEYFAGIDLERLVEVHGPVSPGRTVFLLTQACGSLAEAHEIGMIHRDIKPANIMLCERGGLYDVVKVLDFGMVKSIDVGSQRLDLTQQNTVMGTPMFLAPESIRKRDDVDGRSDLYAIGAVAYYMLTGRNVFMGETSIDIVRKHLDEEPVPPSTYFPGLPADLERVILDCLEKEPARRPASARDLIARFEACQCAHDWSQTEAARWWADSGEDPRSVDSTEPESAPADDPKATVPISPR